MTCTLELGNVKLPDGQEASIQIGGGNILGVTKEPTTGYSINCHGQTVIPAGIDDHVHFRDEEEAAKETWDTGTLAALKGGFTMVCDMPNNTRPVTTYERLIQKLEHIGQRRIDYRLYFGATPDNLMEIEPALKHPMVVATKVYRGSSTGNLLVEDDRAFWAIGELVSAMSSKERVYYIAVHNENEAMMRKNREALGREPKVADHCKIRDTMTELSSVLTTIQMQRDTGCMVDYCHISAPESLEALHSARQSGINMTVQVCTPHYTLCEDGSGNPQRKINPPLRTPQQMMRMSHLITKPDFVDVIASDHAPHNKGEKDENPYDKTPSGLTGVQTGFLLLLNEAAIGSMSLERAIQLSSANAAKLLRVKRGKIEPGYEAELVLVDWNDRTEIDNGMIASKCGWTPYHGMSVGLALKAVVTGGRYIKL